MQNVYMTFCTKIRGKKYFLHCSVILQPFATFKKYYLK